VHFPVSYIYASNRNIGVQDARGDTIAVFCHDRVAGALRRVADVYTGLDQVRGMQIGGVGDGYLIAAGNAGGGVVVYRRLPEGGLQEVARNVEVLTRSSFVWL
jgi:6-phosphogluconolactonase (cycloisomerase 2 family)